MTMAFKIWGGVCILALCITLLFRFFKGREHEGTLVSAIIAIMIFVGGCGTIAINNITHYLGL